MINYLKAVWSGVWTVLIGMRITINHLFVKNVTIQYPKQRFPIPDGSNGTAIARNRLEMDMELCDGCKRCDRACPVNCITVEIFQVAKNEEVAPVLKNGDKRNAWVQTYNIDFAKCCFCGLCTEVCPTDAIHHTPAFEYSTLTRNGQVKYYLEGKEQRSNGLKYSFVNMTEQQLEEKRQKLADYKAQLAAAKAAEAKAKAETGTIVKPADGEVKE